MRKIETRSILRALLFSFLIILSTSCDYEFIEVEDVDPDIQLSFSKDILPIFTANNNCTACHKPGSISPDLTAGSAYHSIVPNLINTLEAEESKIYKYPNPGSSSHSFKKYTQTQAALVLNWIKQGAKDN